MKIAIAVTSSEIECCYGIRRAVFVGEQKVPLELEMDEYDAEAVHFLMRDIDDSPIATARLVDYHGLAKIGRVAVLQEYRGQGWGREIMQSVLEEARRRGFRQAFLSSQTYAIPFYERLGFVAEGDVYDDAGIPHRDMRRRLS